MLNKLTNVIGWITKNVGLLVGIIEAVLKVGGGIASLTPTKKDNKIIAWLEEHSIAKKIQKAADILGKYRK